MVALIGALVCAVVDVDVAHAAEAADAPAVSSVQAFADRIAEALRARGQAEGWRGGVRVSFDDSRGVDVQRARLVLLPRIKKAMKSQFAADGPLRARVALSEEAGEVWAVVVVDASSAGAGIDAPSTIVVSARLDRELSVALGATSKLAQGRFLLEKKGTLRGALSESATCAVLDVALVDFDGDAALELAVLSRCGVEVFRVDDNPRLERVAGPFLLPERRWPRVALGWLVAVPDKPGSERANVLWAATSAGHSVFVDVKAGARAVTPAPEERVPLRSVASPNGPMALRWRFGSPVLSLPLVSPGGIDVVVNGLPARLRDLVRYPVGDAWIFVAEDGSLLAKSENGALMPLAPERTGDRILLVDIDGDNDPELVTSSASSPGEPDQLVLRRIGAGLASSTVLLKSPLSGGSIVGVAAGHVDFDARKDVLVVEELTSGETQVWRLEHAP
jgi:hypothetical protein